MKPFNVEQVEALLLRLNERQKLVREVHVLREEVRDRHRARDFLGDSDAMSDVFAKIDRAARSSATVLVRGESGTGKELVARALHEQSPRAEGPFIKVNCAHSPKRYWPVKCSVMSKAVLPVPINSALADLN